MKRIFSRVLLSLMTIVAVITLVGCTSEPEHILSDAYSSPASVSYSNFRPMYNYYMVTFRFQTLELYEDGTYCLSVISSQFSALVLADEGNDVSANERTNYVTKYYGLFTSEVDSLDEDSLNVSLETPTRVVNIYDQVAFYDTENWTDAMSAIEVETYPGSGEFVTDTQETYLAKYAFNPVTISVTLSTYSFEMAVLVIPEPETE